MSKVELPTEIDEKTVFAEIGNFKKRKFLAAFAKTGQIAKAEKRAKVSWQSHYNWLEKDPDYKLAFARARDIFGDAVDGAMFDSVMNGDERVVTYEGEITAKYRQKSDILRIFALKGLNPEYRDNFNVGSLSGPTTISIIYPSSLPENSLLNRNPVIELPAIEDAQIAKDETAQHFLRPEPKLALPPIDEAKNGEGD
jgi:hypothetical protein